MYPIIVKFFGNNFSYAKEQFKFADSFGYLGVDHCNGFIEGSYKDTKIKLLDCLVMENSNDEPSRLFKGVLISLSRDNSASGKTIAIIGKNKYRIGKDFSNVRKVQAIERKYKKLEIYSNNEEEAEILISTVFVDNLKKLATSFKSGNIQCTFLGNKILLVIPSKTIFFDTSSIYEPITLIDDSNRFMLAIRQLFKFVDTVG